MVLGAADCCAKCGMGEIWHSGDRSTVMGQKPHRFIQPVKIAGKVLVLGDEFYVNFEGDPNFPNDPKGWVKCKFKDRQGSGIVVKPKGFEKFIVPGNNEKILSLTEPKVVK